jgi:cell wall-associated NlpC family hydrolase
MSPPARAFSAACYIDAAMSSAWRDISPAHLRRALHLWLRDQGASNFENNAPIEGKRIVTLPSIKGRTPKTILPGDLAIVGDGIHVLLYLGENRWIQADPSSSTVHEDDTSNGQISWFNGKAVILRPGFLGE